MSFTSFSAITLLLCSLPKCIFISIELKMTMNYITFDETVHATYIKVMSQKGASSRYVQHFFK